MEVRKGSAVVKIYRTKTHGQQSYTVAYYVDRDRVRETFVKLTDAQTRSKELADKIAAGEIGVLKLTAKDRESYLQAQKNIRPTEATLETATKHYAEAVEILGGDLVIEAARYYARKNMTILGKRTVREVVDEMIETKRMDGVSKRHLGDLGARLNRFANDIQAPIAGLLGSDIDNWLRGLNVAARTRKNYRRVIASLANFAIARRYLPKDWDEMDSVPVPKDKGGQIEIFTPSEFKRILKGASCKWRPKSAAGKRP